MTAGQGVQQVMLPTHPHPRARRGRAQKHSNGWLVRVVMMLDFHTLRQIKPKFCLNFIDLNCGCDIPFTPSVMFIPP
jgi:hypothetical protein